VLLKRLILEFGVGGDGVTLDMLMAILEGDTQTYIVEGAAQQRTILKREEVKNHGSDLCPYLESQSSWNDWTRVFAGTWEIHERSGGKEGAGKK
jgi:hypothetical protein